ncbi:hypothetical protein GQ457_10G008350 [Hibiscus cannabinus]
MPLVEALQQMPNYVKFLKDMVSKRTGIGEFEIVDATEGCLAMMHNKVPTKRTDPRSFTILCSIRNYYIGKVLCDPGASINLIPKSSFQKLGIGQTKPTSVMLQLVDRSYVQPESKIEDILVRVDKLIFPINFLILDCEANEYAPIVLGRPFLATGRVLIDFENGELVLRINDQQLKLNVFNSMKHPAETEDCRAIEAITEFDLDIEVTCLDREHMIYLGSTLLDILWQHKKALGWNMADIKGISPSICMHKILLEENYKPIMDTQRKLNQAMKDVVRKEILKWLDAGIIYPISDSEWVSLIQCVPKKGETNLVRNWVKCHFMVDDEIVLVAKINVINKLPPPTTVKGIHSFLGHAGFYRRFIEFFFSKITKPLCSLLKQGKPFDFDNSCTEAFEITNTNNEIKEAFIDEQLLSVAAALNTCTTKEDTIVKALRECFVAVEFWQVPWQRPRHHHGLTGFTALEGYFDVIGSILEVGNDVLLLGETGLGGPNEELEAPGR